MSKLVKIKDNNDFSKDVTVGAIVNTNTDEFKIHLRRKKERERLDLLESKMTNIESLLNDLLKTIKGQ